MLSGYLDTGVNTLTLFNGVINVAKERSPTAMGKKGTKKIRTAGLQREGLEKVRVRGGILALLFPITLPFCRSYPS